jgi:hypothetical protein
MIISSTPFFIHHFLRSGLSNLKVTKYFRLPESGAAAFMLPHEKQKKA